MTRQQKIQLNKERVFYAIAQLIIDGDTHITRYKIGNMASVSHKTVYNILNKYKDSKCLQLQNQ